MCNEKRSVEQPVTLRCHQVETRHWLTAPCHKPDGYWPQKQRRPPSSASAEQGGLNILANLKGIAYQGR